MNDERIINDYILNREMILQIRREFDASKVVDDFARAVQNGEDVEKAGEDIFSSFGERLAKRVIEFGEKKSDLMYEEIKKQVEKLSGRLYFPFVPERFIEIAYLSIFPKIKRMTITEANEGCLSFRVSEGECGIYSGIFTQCGKDTAKVLACEHGCLTLLDTFYADLNVGSAKVKMLGKIPKDTYCEFRCDRIQKGIQEGA
jgi:hypothetical protein